MLEPHKLHSGTLDNFGLGWFIDDYHGMKAGLYGGGSAQVSASVFFVPEKQLAIAGMFNLEGIPGLERIALAEAIADAILGQTTPNPDHFTAKKQSPRDRVLSPSTLIDCSVSLSGGLGAYRHCAQRNGQLQLQELTRAFRSLGSVSPCHQHR